MLHQCFIYGVSPSVSSEFSFKSSIFFLLLLDGELELLRLLRLLLHNVCRQDSLIKDTT